MRAAPLLLFALLLAGCCPGRYGDWQGTPALLCCYNWPDYAVEKARADALAGRGNLSDVERAYIAEVRAWSSGNVTQPYQLNKAIDALEAVR